MKNHLQRIFGRVLIGMGALLAVLGIHGFMHADEFQASTRILISIPNVDDAFSFVTCGLWPGSEREIIESDIVLSNVVRELKLDSEQTIPMDASPEVKTAQAMVALQNRLNVRWIPKSQIIEVQATENSASRAAECANAIVAAYRSEIYDRHREDTLASIQTFKNQIKLQEERIAGLETQLNQSHKTLNLPFPEIVKAGLESDYWAFCEARRNLSSEKLFLTMLTDRTALMEAAFQGGNLQRFGGYRKIETVKAATPPTAPVRRNKVHGLILLATALGSFCFGVTFSRSQSTTPI
jgi:uncharacterized protein involved in exopolysaccharide biosynthesis